MINQISFFAADQLCKIPTGNPFFGFPHWWEYLKGHQDFATSPSQCLPTFAGINDFWLVALAILDMLLRLAGFVAIISIIIAGAQYIFSGGNPEKAASARWRMYNSLIGLAIVAVATAVVAFIGNHFK